MEDDTGKALVQRYIDEFINQRKWQVAEEILGPDFLYHGPNGPARSGRETYWKGSAAFLAAFPDWQARIEDVVCESDLVTDRVRITATHTASINGVPPTGEKIDDDCAHIWRVGEGRLVEGWLFCNGNMLRVMRLASSGK